MTRRLAIFSLVALLASLMGLFVFCWAGTRESHWKQVDEAIQKGLPKTAIEHLDPIIAGAIKDKAYPGSHQGHRQENRPGRQYPGEQARGEDHCACRPKLPRRPRKCSR